MPREARPARLGGAGPWAGRGRGRGQGLVGGALQ